MNDVMNDIIFLLGIYDLEGLIAIGAPSNEYSPEAPLIMEHLNKYGTISPYDIDRIFTHMFGDNHHGLPDAYMMPGELPEEREFNDTNYDFVKLNDLAREITLLWKSQKQE